MIKIGVIPILCHFYLVLNDLHMPSSYKSKERRMAKQVAKANWFKSRKEQGKSTDAQQMVRTEWKSE